MKIQPSLGIYSNPYFDANHITGPNDDECPQRTAVVDQALKEAGLLTHDNMLPSYKAPTEAILQVHTMEYLSTLQDETDALIPYIGQKNGLSKLSTGETTISPESLRVASHAAGAAIFGIDCLMKGVYNRIFCNIRPPGHHASCDTGTGFCILNNAAIAAEYALKTYNLERIAIIDWDVHHGNGTQEIFKQSRNVYYFSTHRFGAAGKKKFYPGTGTEEEIGEGEGRGFTLNCPITFSETPPRVKVLRAFKMRLIPAMEKFKPQLIIISAGFDAKIGDPIGQFDLEDKDFKELTHIVRDIADKYAEGRILSLLEGGYNLESLGPAVVAHVTALIEPDQNT